MAIGGALASASVSKVGFSGYALAIFAGLVVGLGCAYLMRMAGKTVVGRLKDSVSIREQAVRALYFAAMLWIFFAGFLGFWVSLVLLRHLSV
jgi:uncharacterized protein YneF (UPF0154 family)